MERAPDTPHSKYPHVYPIVRIDTPIDQTDPTSRITVVKVLTSQVAAGGRSVTIESDQRRQELHVLLLHQQTNRAEHGVAEVGVIAILQQSLIRVGGFHLNNYLGVTANDNLSTRWLPPRRLRKLLQRAPLEIWLEIRGDLVLAGRNVAEGVGPILIQSVANVVRRWVTISAVHGNTATILV